MKDESARTEVNDAVEKELLNRTNKKSLTPTALSKKNKKGMSNIFDDENDHLIETDQEEKSIIELNSSFDTKTSVSSNTENDSDKENNDNTSNDESTSSDEHIEKENNNSEKLYKLAAQLVTKFDMKTLEKLALLGPKAALIEHNFNPDNRIIAKTEKDNDFKISKSEFQSKHLLESTQMSVKNIVKMPDSQAFISEPADKSQPGPSKSNINTARISNSACTSNTTFIRRTSNNTFVRRTKIFGIDNMFKGDMFLVKNSELGIALDEAKSIYCLEIKYAQAENATSATMAGRRLLDGVFTLEALSICSLSGMPPSGKGKSTYVDKSFIKPYLCPKVVNAIIEKALYLQKMKHWRPKKDSGQIRQAMAVRLNDIASQYGKENP